jgi:predicted lipase
MNGNFTKSHYKEIAEIIASVPTFRVVRKKIIAHFADYFDKKYENFNRKKFTKQANKIIEKKVDNWLKY